MYCKTPGAGFRRGSEAAHPDRHLRAVARLLRRLLPQGAEDPPPDRAGLRRGVQAMRRDHGADLAQRCVRARRQGVGPGADVPERHLHDLGEPRRPAGDVDSLRLRRKAICRSGCRSTGNYFAEARHAAGRAPVPARDRLAPARSRRESSKPCEWETVIGLETHAQLSTVSKIFSGASTAVRRGAQRAGLRGGHRAARRAAGAEPGRGGTGHPFRPGRRRATSAAARCSRARTTSIPTCPRATRSASTNCRSCRAGTVIDRAEGRGEDRAAHARAPGRGRRANPCTRISTA